MNDTARDTTPQTIVAHGHCARVIDTPSQGTSYLRIELPVELHAQLTQRFYGRSVLVVLAGPEFQAQPYGLTVQTLPDDDSLGAPGKAPARGARQPRQAGSTGPLCLSAVKLCAEPAFTRYVAQAIGEDREATADEAASYIRQFCMVGSRRDLDSPECVEAKALFRRLMADYRRWQLVNAVEVEA